MRARSLRPGSPLRARRSLEDLRGAVAALEADLVSAGGAVGAVGEIDEELAVDLHAALRVAVDSQQPGSHRRVELVVPAGVEGVRNVEAASVVGELEHVGPAAYVAAAVVGLAEHAAEPELAGERRVGRVGDVVL